VPVSELEFTYPSDGLLRQGLAELFAARSASEAASAATPDVTIIEREPMPVPGSHPLERVLLEVDGRREHLCCKYGGHSDPAHYRHGNRHGTAYEASVYERVLRHLDVTAPRVFGLVDKEGWRWLVIDYLDDATTVTRTGSADVLDDAGRWLARFHRQTEGWAASSRASFLHRHTADYYLACAERTLEFASGLPRRRPWLAKAVRRYRSAAVPLLVSHQTVIHGEFYSSNVLYGGGVILPIDWESAAIGAPEIDLAFLLEGWTEEDRVRVLHRYAEARWSGAAPADFRARFDAAVLFTQFRWLGDRLEWTADGENQWRFKLLLEGAFKETFK
jgi:hypothetical protein